MASHSLNCGTPKGAIASSQRFTGTAIVQVRRADLDNPEGQEMTAAQSTIVDWLYLIRAEFLEMPGLLLTKEQIQRLWGLDATTCEALLDALVDARFLRRTDAGAYVRFDGGPVRVDASRGYARQAVA